MRLVLPVLPGHAGKAAVADRVADRAEDRVAGRVVDRVARRLAGRILQPNPVCARR